MRRRRSARWPTPASISTILTVLEVAGAPTLRVPIDDAIRDIVLPVTLYNTAIMLLLLPLLNRLPESQDL
ncbi:hypothetical protein [Caldilinea sp.]|uniref:hypothetical protein n=1 Tax=Caldilinea sp. TaxID=2293560 RepID=UPI002631F52F|nr:hypothetical protein [Caldilinea sp.]